MKHFKLKIILTLLAIAVVSACATLLFSNHNIALGILISFIIPILILINQSLLSKLINSMSSFVRGLEMNDTSMRFEADTNDTELNEMSKSMNRITSMYVGNKRELETRKLYYDRILKVMTHEMRNAIAPIVALSTDLHENPGNYGETERTEAMEIIRNQSEGIKRFLDSYHALTHLPPPEQKQVDAAGFLHKLQKSISCVEETIFSHQGIVEYNIGAGTNLFIDESLMSQVMVNLIKNSLEAAMDNPEPKVIVTATRSAGGSIITITDNGKGLPQEIAENPFQPFLTTKKNGSGIGLFLSRQIVRMHGGDIRMHNLPGKGLSIQIILPTQ